METPLFVAYELERVQNPPPASPPPPNPPTSWPPKWWLTGGATRKAAVAASAPEGRPRRHRLPRFLAVAGANSSKVSPASSAAKCLSLHSFQASSFRALSVLLRPPKCFCNNLPSILLPLTAAEYVCIARTNRRPSESTPSLRHTHRSRNTGLKHRDGLSPSSGGYEAGVPAVAKVCWVACTMTLAAVSLVIFPMFSIIW